MCSSDLDADVHGPVDFALLEFPRDRLTGEAGQALMRVVSALRIFAVRI